ncbi:MAG: CgeB family protein [Rhodospirillaceae bacterium]
MIQGKRSILYIGDGDPNSTSGHRCAALRRLGHRVHLLNTGLSPLTVGERAFGPWATRLLSTKGLRGLADPLAAGSMQKTMLRTLTEHGPFDLVWVDKGSLVSRATVELGRGAGLITVHYTSDPPYAHRAGDPRFGRLTHALPAYDLCVTPGEEHRPGYARLGVERLAVMPFCYEPEIHRPPPSDWSDADRPYDAVFVGTPLEDRIGFLSALVEDYGIRLGLFGGRWTKLLSPAQQQLLQPGPERIGLAYRDALWSGKVCLGLHSPSMDHRTARRWVEIAACGGVLLAQRTDGFAAQFIEGVEAEAFSDVADCATKIKALVADPVRRAALSIAAQARVRPLRSNDQGLQEILDRL